jgi:RNA polymerase sigma-70 factor (ECF subfamily)
VVEAQIREAWDRQDMIAALTRLLECYGLELQRYLVATSGPTEAHDIYSMLAEDLWKGLPAFQWRCSARAWAYTLARHARARYVVAERRRATRQDTLSHLPWLRDLVERTRTPTPLHERSDVRHGLRLLRERLDERDRTLLMLRVDRGLSWKELAIVLDDVGPDEAEAIAAARQRQRFQAIKKRLRAMAQEDGLLDEERDGA